MKAVQYLISISSLLMWPFYQLCQKDKRELFNTYLPLHNDTQDNCSTWLLYLMSVNADEVKNICFFLHIFISSHFFASSSFFITCSSILLSFTSFFFFSFIYHYKLFSCLTPNTKFVHTFFFKLSPFPANSTFSTSAFLPLPVLTPSFFFSSFFSSPSFSFLSSFFHSLSLLFHSPSFFYQYFSPPLYFLFHHLSFFFFSFLSLSLPSCVFPSFYPPLHIHSFFSCFSFPSSSFILLSFILISFIFLFLLLFSFLISNPYIFFHLPLFLPLFIPPHLTSFLFFLLFLPHSLLLPQKPTDKSID
ncbi:unnamed protein product [Acanthosepion pharaonis]|uniref:Uncharacterized protein n=1 Tax=Acanthosepion pharaonis TaxID=158019 RepID=A0A812DG13_ACAPH|nr:unnamed protein product [Sepia pharaonis]